MEKPVQQPATEGEPKQVTEKGYEFPVPSRESIFSAFKKITKAKKG
jgi:hypothetical protein